MADGIRLGGAFYELTADSAGLVRALSQAEQASKKSAQAISQQTGLAEKDVQRLASSWIASEKRRADASAQTTLRIIKAHNDAAASVEKSAAQQAKATQQANAAFLTITRTVGGFAAAAVGVTVGAATISAAMTKIAESTQKAAQAQFALNALYGQSAPIITKQAEELAKTSGRSRTEALEAATAVATLGRSYALTFEQQRKVLEISANLAAIRGISLEEATKRVSDAIRGEAEAAEYLGQVLNNDAVKAFANMTAEQRKNFESLDPLTRAQITFGKLNADNADLMGKAAEAANSAVGANAKLAAAIDNLSVSIGQRLSPVFVPALNTLTSFVEKSDEFARGDFINRLEQTYNILAAMATLDPAKIAAALVAAQAAFLPGFQVGPDPGAPGGTNPGPTSPATTGAIAEERRRQEQRIAADRKNAAKAALEAADKANDATADSAIKAIDKERKEKERWYDEERQRIEARRTYQLEDIEARRDAAIAALEEEKRASKEALEAQIEDQERLKDARLAAAEQAADSAKAAIEAEKDRLETVRELEDRARDDARRHEDENTEGIRRTQDRQIEDARRRQDQAAEDEQESELRRLKKRGDERAKAIEDDIERTEAASQRKLRALDREGDRARKNSDDAIRDIEEQADEEDDRHRNAMQALEDEQDARLGILDTQLKALDAQEKSADAAERIAGIQKRLNEAQRDAAAAKGTGTPAQITAARGDLTRAIRSGDPIAEANAREQLVKLAGKGNEEIKKADEALADAQKDLAKESVDTARDAERNKLKVAQDAIRDEIEARKRSEDDENRRRRASLDADKQAEQDKLKDFQDKLAKRKQSRQDDAKDETEKLRTNLEAAKKASQDEIEIARGRFEVANDARARERVEDDRKREDFRREEDRVRTDERTAQDRFRADERAEQDKALAVQLAAVAATLKLERDETEIHFNGSNGTITQLRKAIDASALEYDRRLKKVRESYEDERKAAERKYTNPEKNGELDLLEKQRQAEIDALGARKDEYQEQAKAFHDMIAAMLDDLDEFIRRNGEVPRIGAGAGHAGAGSREAGSGAATSASGATSRSGESGKDVKGTLATWINDAMDITGVGDDWLSGIDRLIQLESGGDPHRKNMQGSGASGLMQMMPDTFKGYRDKSLPNDIWDPVANLVASIRYIQQEYLTGHKTGFPADINWIVQNHSRRGGYDAGGMLSNPTLTFDTRTGARGILAERGPEYLIGRKATAMIGRGPQSNYTGVGAFMAQAHPGSAGRSSSVVEGDVIFNGVTYEEAERRQRSQRHRERLLRRVP